MRIVNPTFGYLSHKADPAARQQDDWRTAPICMFTNSKPNATELLNGIREQLSARFQRTDIGFAAKQNAARPADPDTIDWLAQQYRIVVLAVGD